LALNRPSILHGHGCRCAETSGQAAERKVAAQSTRNTDTAAANANTRSVVCKDGFLSMMRLSDEAIL
jgi:hypothetical protein